MGRKRKQEQLTKLKPNQYRIYGIFDFKSDKLVYVHMDYEQTELEFEIGDYDSEQYDIVSFDVVLV